MEDGWTTYWVIEKRPAEIGTGRHTHRFYAVHDGNPTWVSDSATAVHFVRGQDAEAILSLPEWKDYLNRPDADRIFAQQVWTKAVDIDEEAA